MKCILISILFICSSCENDRIDLSLSEVSFSKAPLNTVSFEQLQEITKDPAVRFGWKKALVQRLLEEKIEKVHTEIDKKDSDAFMAQAEAELIQPNGIQVSGVVFFIPKPQKDKMSDDEKGALGKRAEILAAKFYRDLLLNPSDPALRQLLQDTEKQLPSGLKLNLKVGTKILARSEVATPGWLFIPDVLDSHKDSNIDNVAAPVTVGTSVFVTILRERINVETLFVDVIRERADVIALAESRQAAVVNLFGVATKDLSLELFPDVIQKDGTVE